MGNPSMAQVVASMLREDMERTLEGWFRQQRQEGISRAIEIVRGVDLGSAAERRLVDEIAVKLEAERRSLDDDVAKVSPSREGR